MTVRQHLLPTNSTPFERAVSESLDREPELGPGADAMHAFKFRAPNDTILPSLVVEYGLGPITPYLPDLATVIAYGVPWNRVKGTPEGVRGAMSWVGYAFDLLYEAPTHYTRWHLFELELDRVWEDEADLDTIEDVVRLSQPARSEFWRGYKGYNVRELQWSASAWGDAMWGDVSGVRLHEGGVKWSFGRTHEPEGGEYTFVENDLAPLGLWIEPLEDGNVTWGPFAWTTPGLKWASNGDQARTTAIASGLLPLSFWVALRRANGSIFGYRKARSVHCVVPAFGGRFQVGDTSYEPAGDMTNRVYVEALTGFGEGEGEELASWSLVINGSLPAGSKPGVQWLEGDTLVGGVVVGEFPISAVRVGKTERERVRAIFRI